MNVQDLKKQLVEKIQKTNDNLVLEEILRLLEIESESMGAYTLSEDQVQVINEAQEQIKQGKFLSNDDANTEINQWLGK
jgi:hypothetical protein